MRTLLVSGLLLVGPSVALAQPVQVCEMPDRSIHVTTIVADSPEEYAQKWQRTLEAVPALQTATCQTMETSALPASKAQRYAWRLTGQTVTVDNNVPKPQDNDVSIPIEALGGTLGGTLAALGVASLTGRRRKEPS